MNELVAILSFVGLALCVLTAARLGQIYLYVISVTFILLSNITVQMPVPVFGVEISWAIIIYSLVYFITDLLCEYHGKTAGYRLAATNLAVQIIMWAYVWASLQVTPASSGQPMYLLMQSLFGTTAQVTFAAIVAAAGPFLDIYIFTWIRRRWDIAATRQMAERTLLAAFFNNRVLAIVARNKLSTFAGQVVNTAIFFTLVLLNTGMPASTIVSIIVSAIVVKIAIAIADIPFLIAAERVLHLERTVGV